MTSNSQSFAIDKYSFCDVPMAQTDAKPIWNHHSARDHIYVVLNNEGPLEQPSDPSFPYMNNLTLKIIWRAETLESVSVSDFLRPKTSYVGFPNIVCMIRSPSLALKYINIRGHTLRRMQVRFCRQGDYQAVISALERVGCPVQIHNVEPVLTIQPNGINRQHTTLDTANSILTTSQYSRPGSSTVTQYAAPVAPIENRTPWFPQGNGHISHRQHLSHPIVPSQHPQFLNRAIQHQIYPQNQPSHLPNQPAFHSSPPQLLHRQNSNGISRANFLQRRSTDLQAGSSQPIQSHPHTLSYQNTVPQPANPFDNEFHPHLRHGGSATSSLISRPLTNTSLATSIPLSRGTLTSAGTLTWRNSQPQADYPRNIESVSQQRTVEVTASQQHPTPFDISDTESIPPPRQLPDFEKINKVHGDKPLPSSSAKLTATLKSSKAGATVNALKRKRNNDSAPPSTAPSAVTYTAKAKGKRVTVDKSIIPLATATPPPKKKPVAASRAKKQKLAITPTGKKLIAEVHKSSVKTPPHTPSKVLRPTPPSKLNKKVGSAAKTKSQSAESTILQASSAFDVDVLDENLLVQMIHSDEHLKMVQRLEKVWSRMGFGVRIKSSKLFTVIENEGEGHNLGEK
ncbi:hypothetical protein TWF694_010538 [Orbilia ellipsospora]|uniref:Uncharacterized protein n=1 Tax=Orbilia ellipsospora TaxID=2528407 RepID=A0AAV9XA65_9PEZI